MQTELCRRVLFKLWRAALLIAWKLYVLSFLICCYFLGFFWKLRTFFCKNTFFIFYFLQKYVVWIFLQKYGLQLNATEINQKCNQKGTKYFFKKNLCNQNESNFFQKEVAFSCRSYFCKYFQKIVKSQKKKTKVSIFGNFPIFFQFYHVLTSKYCGCLCTPLRIGGLANI